MFESPSKFVWYDIMTTDIDAAAKFYTNVIGWGVMDSGQVDRPYRIFTVGQTMAAGLMPIPADAQGAPPMWMGYIGVDSVDVMVPRLTAAGGQLKRPAQDIPNNVGRFAVVADPHGTGFILFKPNGPEQPGNTQFEEGRVGWHELHSGDWESAWAFYSGLFGWTKTEAMDMGPMGTYQIFATGGAPIGGIMTKMPEMPVPMWLFYFNVDSVGAALQRIKDSGGTVINGPMQVPGGQWIVQALDPQGAMFAVVSMKE
jgi:uncharacterized protein